MKLDIGSTLIARTENTTTPVVLCASLLDSLGYRSTDRRYAEDDSMLVVWMFC
jgi:hypothetical protein